MAMTPQQELAMLETAYANYLATGIAEYTTSGRTIVRMDFAKLVSRMDALRMIVYRQTHGMFGLSRLKGDGRGTEISAP